MLSHVKPNLTLTTEQNIYYYRMHAAIHSISEYIFSDVWERSCYIFFNVECAFTHGKSQGYRDKLKMYGHLENVRVTDHFTG